MAAALAHEDEEQRESARDALRGFITAIVILPGDGLLEVRGDLGGCWQQPPASETAQRWRLLLMMVAGARNQHYLQLWRPAA